MIVTYRLRCGHTIDVTASSLDLRQRRLTDPREWWCRACELDQDVVERTRP
jgi:hypothetical protein